MFQNFTKKQKSILGFTFLILLVSIGLFTGYKERKALGMHTAFTTGEIYDLTTSPKSAAVAVKYKYLVEQQHYKGQNDLTGYKKSEDLQILYRVLLEKSFPVAYDNLDVDNSKILITKEQYIHFNIERPVSMEETFRIIDSNRE